jgi:hypothetical protein
MLKDTCFPIPDAFTKKLVSIKQAFRLFLRITDPPAQGSKQTDFAHLPMHLEVK